MELYHKPEGIQTRWVSFENPTGERNRGGLENNGAKGHAFDTIESGETKTLLDMSGSGLITRIWMTLSERHPKMLRSLRIDITWDNAKRPAVSCPLGDFFGVGLGLLPTFECRLFSSPEGRSFNCFVPMPFRKSAKITITNEGPEKLGHIYYDVDLLTNMDHPNATLYFHTHWRRENPNTLGEEYVILPPVSGQGRFLGCNIGVTRNPVYEKTWWGEGEVKIRFGNDENPTLCGTGTEDYIGTGWGQGVFFNRSQGCPISDPEKGMWAFYRYHLDDPVYFDDGCSVAIQTIGGASRQKVIQLLAKKAPLIPVSIDPKDHVGPLIPLMEYPQPVDHKSPDLPEGWCNFWRQDDWSSAAYFYLDAPETALPQLTETGTRVRGLVDPTEENAKRLDNQ